MYSCFFSSGLWKQGLCRYLLCTGGYKTRKDISEAQFMIDIAIQLGVPADTCLKEDRANTTIGNALFSNRIMDDKGLKSAIVITSRYHMPRTKYIFKKLLPGKELSFAACKNNLKPRENFRIYSHELRHLLVYMFRGLNIDQA